VRLVVAADTDTLDDWSFDADGSVEAPGGRPVAEWLFGRLSGTPATADDVRNHKGYGWWFNICIDSGSVWCLVASGAGEGSMYFWAEPPFRLWQSLIGRRKRYDLSILEAVQGLLEQDSRFRNVRIQAPGS
jgi:hypothetical protein